LFELERLGAFAAARNVRAAIYLRVTPGIEAHTHDYIKTGQIDSKFGFPLGDALDTAVARALANPALDLAGFHCHIGSQIHELTPFADAAQIMAAQIARVKARHGHSLRELDLGGGLGIRYTGEDDPKAPGELARQVVAALERASREHGIARPRVLVEPGRSIVGEAGTTLYTVGSVKEIPGVRTYAAIDGGMGDNPRVALYKAKYEAVLANKAGRTPDRRVSIAGKCCESGDMLIWDLDVPEIGPGDILAIFSTGAYNYAMAGNYNRLPRPAMVLVQGGRAEVIVERERYEDLARFDRIPLHLAAAAVEGPA
ncbi:MAG TPA: diaminopimelate decarboxylase, partial [Limnochordia bacterium]|nr:diaminopimelate decarboxylase [Limnochordia bacterium]